MLPKEIDIQLDGPCPVLGTSYTEFLFSYSKINEHDLPRCSFHLCRLFILLFFPAYTDQLRHKQENDALQLKTAKVWLPFTQAVQATMVLLRFNYCILVSP